ncbi:hypothetical protein Nepgr_019486 [Nepenthes gracilis]|uniref:Uncharacterized protein n=1 Tax=Nepenthes gracilis TaxID=150966 RepID=A0AAD3STN6_NEPGR|nr:hypothetical protein Nepgr_019486 [Nepenthes gracilis]
MSNRGLGAAMAFCGAADAIQIRKSEEEGTSTGAEKAVILRYWRLCLDEQPGLGHGRLWCSDAISEFRSDPEESHLKSHGAAVGSSNASGIYCTGMRCGLGR